MSSTGVGEPPDDDGGVSSGAGSGGRKLLGTFVLLLDIFIFVTAHVLLYLRADKQPLKILNPVLLSTMMFFYFPMAFWVPLREMGVISISCGSVVWLAVLTALTFAIPILIMGYRLVLTTEKTIDMVRYFQTSRMLFLSLIALTPPLVYVPIFLAFDKSYDWDAHHTCSYYNNDIIPYALTIAYMSAIGYRIVLNLWKVNDGWGIRRNLFIVIVYADVLIVIFILINLFVPNVNASVIESAYAVHLVGTLSTLQLVVWPALSTFWFQQPKTGLRGGGGAPRLIIGGGRNGRGGQNIPLLEDGGNGGKRVKGRLSTGGELSRSHRSSDAGGEHSKRRKNGGETKRGKMMSSVASNLANHDLMKVLTNPHGYALFLSYAQREFAAENVLFWSAVEGFRAEPTVDAAARIYLTFVGPDAPLQVNISHFTLKITIEAIRPFMPAEVLPPSAMDLVSPPISPVGSRENSPRNRMKSDDGQGRLSGNRTPTAPHDKQERNDEVVAIGKDDATAARDRDAVVLSSSPPLHPPPSASQQSQHQQIAKTVPTPGVIVYDPKKVVLGSTGHNPKRVSGRAQSVISSGTSLITPASAPSGVGVLQLSSLTVPTLGGPVSPNGTGNGATTATATTSTFGRTGSTNNVLSPHAASGGTSGSARTPSAVTPLIVGEGRSSPMGNKPGATDVKPTPSPLGGRPAPVVRAFTYSSTTPPGSGAAGAMQGTGPVAAANYALTVSAAFAATPNNGGKGSPNHGPSVPAGAPTKTGATSRRGSLADNKLPESFAFAYDLAQREIFLMMESDSFPRFNQRKEGRECEYLWKQPTAQTPKPPDEKSNDGGPGPARGRVGVPARFRSPQHHPITTPTNAVAPSQPSPGTGAGLLSPHSAFDRPPGSGGSGGSGSGGAGGNGNGHASTGTGNGSGHGNSHARVASTEVGAGRMLFLDTVQEMGADHDSSPEPPARTGTAGGRGSGPGTANRHGSASGGSGKKTAPPTAGGSSGAPGSSGGGIPRGRGTTGSANNLQPLTANEAAGTVGGAGSSGNRLSGSRTHSRTPSPRGENKPPAAPTAMIAASASPAGGVRASSSRTPSDAPIAPRTPPAPTAATDNSGAGAKTGSPFKTGSAGSGGKTGSAGSAQPRASSIASAPAQTEHPFGAPVSPPLPSTFGSAPQSVTLERAVNSAHGTSAAGSATATSPATTTTTTTATTATATTATAT